MKQQTHPSLYFEGHAYLMIKLVRLVQLRVQDQLAAQGIDYTFPQNAVLVTLRESPGMSAAELARIAMVKPQTINKFLIRLYKDSLIEARADPSHGRIRQIFLTRRGEQLLEKLDRISSTVEQRMFQQVSAKNRSELEATLKKCIVALQGH